jgi:protein SCO1/2
MAADAAVPYLPSVEVRMLKRLFQILTGLLLGVVAVLWLFGPPGAWRDAPPESEYFLPSPLPSPSFTLTAQDGQRTSTAEFAGKVLAVFFGYTSCPDVCPLTLAKFTRVLQNLDDGPERIQVVMVSVDPERDSLDRLQAYLENFHPSFIALTGSEVEIQAVADEFGVFFSRSGEGDDYTVDHTARTFIVDPDGQIPLTFPVTATVEEMNRDLDRLLGGIG